MEDYKFLELRKKDSYEYVARKNAKGAVVVIPWKMDGFDLKFQLIKSIRPTFDKPIIEFPAGLLDAEGETPIDAAIRELKEETGWIGKYEESFALFNPFRNDTSSAGLTDETIAFVPLELIEKGEPRFDGSEKIEILPLMTAKEIFEFILVSSDEYYFSARLTAFLSGMFFKMAIV